MIPNEIFFWIKYLFVDKIYDWGSDSGAHDKHAMKVMLQHEWLYERAEEQQYGVEYAHENVLLFVAYEAYELVEYGRTNELKQVVHNFQEWAG